MSKPICYVGKPKAYAVIYKVGDKILPLLHQLRRLVYSQIGRFMVWMIHGGF